MPANNAHSSAPSLISDFVSLTKPKVNMLIMLTALVGAVLASFQHPVNPDYLFLALLGIAMLAGSAAAFNCLVETVTDSTMKRTRNRPLPTGRLGRGQAMLFVMILGTAGMILTTVFGGVLTGLLAAFTFFGYAVIYTLYLKNATPQNIVIGGASGAMPPLLGWCAVTGEISFEPMLLFLIIFVWTPPHFWALALYRHEDYKNSGYPMLPVTHGARFTATHILLYSLILFAVSLLPYLSGMANAVYLIAAVLLGARFCLLARQLHKTLNMEISRRLFSYSIHYLGLLFLALIADRVLAPYLQ